MERGLTVKKLSKMRKQHARLNKIMELIQRCDRMIQLDIEICGVDDATLFPKYDRIRQRLYRAYGERLEYMVNTILDGTERA
jgi:hypothetical protein